MGLNNEAVTAWQTWGWLQPQVPGPGQKSYTAQAIQLGTPEAELELRSWHKPKNLEQLLPQQTESKTSPHVPKEERIKVLKFNTTFSTTLKTKKIFFKMCK